MSSINERLQIIIDELFEGNKAAFAKAVGIAPTSISNYLGGKRQSKPSSDLLERIVYAIGGISTLWLLTGEGEMIVGGSGASTADHGGVAISGNSTAHHFTTNASADAVLEERVKSLEALLKEKETMIAEKERLIKVYEKLLEGK